MHLLKDLALAMALAYVAAVSGTLAADASSNHNWPDSTDGCMVLPGADGGMSARYLDPKTLEVLEAVSVPAAGTPVIIRSRDPRARGSIRKYCTPMVLDVLGGTRGRQLMRLSD